MNPWGLTLRELLDLAVEQRRCLEELAAAHNGPCYVSFLSGLGTHGILADVPRALQVACLGCDHTAQFHEGEVEFISLPEDLFFGYRPGATIPVAEPEKALADALFWYEQKGHAPEWVENVDFKEFDESRLREYADAMGVSIDFYREWSRVS